MDSGFGTAGYTTVLLPSGYRVRGIVPSLAILAERDLLTREVVSAAASLAAIKHREQIDDPRTEQDLRVWVDALVMGFAHEAQDPGADEETGEWKPVRLTSVAGLDQRDRMLLESLVLHQMTADEVTAASRAAMDATEREEGPSVMERLVAFRDVRRGAAPDDDGSDVARAPVDVAGG